MLKQERMGYYTDGNREIQIGVYNCREIDIDYITESRDESFPSLEALNNHLVSILSTEKLYMPEIVTEAEKWFAFDISESFKAFSQKQPNGYTKTITVNDFSTGDYIVFQWEHNYNCEFTLIKDCLDFAEELGRNPISDLEADVYRMSKHGSSGMDKVWRFKTLEEADTFLLETFGITGQEDTSKGLKINVPVPE